MRLRSRHRRVATARGVGEAVAALEPTERRLLLDTLGELALTLACRPPAAWAGSPDELAEWTGPGVASVSASLVVHRAADLGLLVGAPSGDLRFRDADTLVWLAARRTVEGEDGRGLGAFRLRGALFDVFAMAVAELGESTARPMVRELVAGGGAAPDVLELAALQAGAACAWGATADPELRAALINHGATWTGGGGLPFHRAVGAALLSAEGGREPFGQRVRADLRVKVESTAHEMSRPGLSQHPVLAAMLDADLAGLAGSDAIAPTAWAELATWLGPLGEAFYRALGATAWPGSDRDGLLVEEVRRGLAAGESLPLMLLGDVDPANREVVALAAEALDLGLASNLQSPVEQCVVATRAVAAWRHVEGGIVEQLAALVLGDVPPRLRLAAARSLAAHPLAVEPKRAELLESLEAARADSDPAARTGIVGAALHLGSQSPETAAIAVALVAEGYGGADLPEALANALTRGNGAVSGLADLLARFDRRAVRQALVRCLEPAAARLEEALTKGVYAEPGADLAGSREGLCRVLLSVAFDLDDPELAARAAMLMGWFGRGDGSLASRFRAARVGMPPGAARDGFAMALGAVGSVDDATVEDLARDLALGPPLTVAASAQALRWLVNGPATAALVEPWVAASLGRAARDPRCRIDLLGLARHVAMAPLQDTPLRRER